MEATQEASVAERAGIQAAERRCRNCEAPLSTPFCGYCGQSGDDRPLTVRGILSDVVEDQLSVNGSTLRTFSGLFRPGFLTREYLCGRIVRYVPPFRLFLLSTTFFVLAGAYVMHRQEPQIEVALRRAKIEAQKRAVEDARAGRPVRPLQVLHVPIDSTWMPAAGRALVRPILKKQDRINAMPLERSVPLVMGTFMRASSYLVLPLVPAAAGLLALVYWRRRRPFAEHVVFTLHTHAFALLLMGIGSLAQLAWQPLNIVTNGLILPYMYVAMVGVYGDGWLRTIPRYVAFIGLYAALMTVAGPFLQLTLLLLT